MKYLILICGLLLAAPTMTHALQPSSLLLAQRSDDAKQGGASTVIIKGKGGKVTGVDTRPKGQDGKSDQRKDKNGKKRD